MKNEQTENNSEAIIMKIRLAAPIQTDSIVDGEGIRTVIWTQGCLHNCPRVP